NHHHPVKPEALVDRSHVPIEIQSAHTFAAQNDRLELHESRGREAIACFPRRRWKLGGRQVLRIAGKELASFVIQGRSQDRLLGLQRGKNLISVRAVIKGKRGRAVGGDDSSERGGLLDR